MTERVVRIPRLNDLVSCRQRKVSKGGSTMTEWQILVSIMLGGAITLIGTLLSNWLQYRAEARNLKRGRLQERFDKIREYLCSWLHMVNLVVTWEEFEKTEGVKDAVEGLIKRELEALLELPVKPYTYHLYVRDRQALMLMSQFESLTTWFGAHSYELVRGQRPTNMPELRERQQALRDLTSKVSERLDKLLESV